MRKFVLLGMSMMLLMTTQASAWIDIFGKNKERKINFANQVIGEILTPEEMSQKVRIQELSQSDGNDLSIIDIVSGKHPNFNHAIHYYLELLFKETTHEELIKICRLGNRGALTNNLLNRQKKYGSYKFDIISEHPKDIIYIAETYAKDPNDDFGIICIGRDIRIGKWKSFIRHFFLASELSEEKRKSIIHDLKNNPSINNWVSNRKKI